jgi:phasin family protein
MTDVRPSLFDFDVSKFVANFRFRPLDLDAWLAYQRRNVEAFTQANQVAVDGAQAVARKQIEMARQSIEDVTALWRDLAQPASAEERVVKNTEYAKQMLEKSVNHGREITMLATKVGADTVDVLRRRASASLDEIRDYAKQQTTAPVAA